MEFEICYVLGPQQQDRILILKVEGGSLRMQKTHHTGIIHTTESWPTSALDSVDSLSTPQRCVCPTG
jgi:hypothetical protein